MRRYLSIIIVSAIVLTLFLSCSTNRQIINRKFTNLEGKESITVVVVGNAFFESKWVSETSSDFNRYLRSHLEDIFGVPVSLINASYPEDTFMTFKRRIESDVLSYRPDIVFFMLGLVDSNQTELTNIYFRDQVRMLFGDFKEHGTDVIVLTSIGNRSALSPYDPGIQRLMQFNEIILFEAGHHDFAVVDSAEHFERLRVSDPERYYTFFNNELMLNQAGKEYVFDNVFQYIRKAYKSN